MFFKQRKNQDDNKPNGLYASLEELIAQRKFLPYIHQRQNYITSDMAGDIRSAFKGRGMEFEEVRTYGFGDDVRDIDWRVTARKGDTYTKVFAEEKDREVYVVLDLSPYMVFGTKKELKSVSASKLAALLGWQSLSNKDRFGLILYNGDTVRLFKPQNNQKNLMAILKAISEMSEDILKPEKTNKIENADLSSPLRFLQYNLKSRAMVFVISDFNNISEQAKKDLIALSAKSKIYCLNIYDIIEENAPQSGEYMVEYLGEKLVFNSSPEKFKEMYNQYFMKKRTDFAEFCKRFKCQHLNIRTDRPLYKQLKIQ